MEVETAPEFDPETAGDDAVKALYRTRACE
jgi:hypothetical protein